MSMEVQHEHKLTNKIVALELAVVVVVLVVVVEQVQQVFELMMLVRAALVRSLTVAMAVDGMATETIVFSVCLSSQLLSM